MTHADLFDAEKWLLLPDMAILRDVDDFVQGVIDARKDPTRPQIHTFRSKVSSLLTVDLFWL
jgi:hypothetical protein